MIDFDTPQPATQPDRLLMPHDVAGRTVAAHVDRYFPAHPTAYGPQPAVELTLFDADGNQVHTGVKWFAKRIVRTLQNSVGRFVVFRVSRGEPYAPGQPGAWDIEIVTDATEFARLSPLIEQHKEKSA